MQQQQQQLQAAAAVAQQQAQTQQRAGQAGLKGDGGAAFDPASAANAERDDDASGETVRYVSDILRQDDCVRWMPAYIGQPPDIYRRRVAPLFVAAVAIYTGSWVDSVAYVADWTAACHDRQFPCCCF